MTDEVKERPKTLGEVYVEKGLMRPTQFKKRIPRDERKKWKEVEFAWGTGTVRGYRKPTPRKKAAKKDEA